MINELLLSEFDEELKKTRAMLERVPMRSDFKPHAKSMPLGKLAPHVAQLAGFGLTILTTPELDFSKSSIKPLPFESTGARSTIPSPSMTSAPCPFAPLTEPASSAITPEIVVVWPAVWPAPRVSVFTPPPPPLVRPSRKIAEPKAWPDAPPSAPPPPSAEPAPSVEPPDDPSPPMVRLAPCWTKISPPAPSPPPARGPCLSPPTACGSITSRRSCAVLRWQAVPRVARYASVFQGPRGPMSGACRNGVSRGDSPGAFLRHLSWIPQPISAHA